MSNVERQATWGAVYDRGRLISEELKRTRSRNRHLEEIVDVVHGLIGLNKSSVSDGQCMACNDDLSFFDKCLEELRAENAAKVDPKQ